MRTLKVYIYMDINIEGFHLTHPRIIIIIIINSSSSSSNSCNVSNSTIFMQDMYNYIPEKLIFL